MQYIYIYVYVFVYFFENPASLNKCKLMPISNFIIIIYS